MAIERGGEVLDSRRTIAVTVEVVEQLSVPLVTNRADDVGCLDGVNGCAIATMKVALMLAGAEAAVDVQALLVSTSTCT